MSFDDYVAKKAALDEAEARRGPAGRALAQAKQRQGAHAHATPSAWTRPSPSAPAAGPTAASQEEGFPAAPAHAADVTRRRA